MAILGGLTSGREQVLPANVLSTTIPNDIWLCIAQFIPPKTLRTLYSLNSFFLDLAMNERHKEANFLQVDQRSIALLVHMRDPNISSRVRRVRVNPVWFNLDGPTRKVSLRSIVANSLPIKLRSSSRGVPAQNRLQPKDRKHIDTLTTDIVVHFSNVTMFVLITRYSPHPRSLPLFLTNSWQTFGSNLRRLTLNAPLSGFKVLLPCPDQLLALEELRLRFSTDMSSDDHEADTTVLREALSPFLRKLGPRLVTLNLLSSALGDHSVLFRALDHTPYLRSLALNIGFYPPLLQDPSSFIEFMKRNTSTLKHVKLQPLETFRSPATTGPAHDSFINLLMASAVDEHLLRDLETLVVLPATAISSTSRLDATILYIPRSRDTLTTLVLGERCISFVDLTTLVSNFCHRSASRGLKILHVKLISLNPEVFDLLADKLVGLDDLDIKFNLLLPKIEDEGPRPLDDQEPTQEVITAFLAEMAKRVYPHWKLYSLWIWQRSHMTTRTAQEILAALKPSIPSVRVIHRMDQTHHLHTLFN